MRDYPHEFSGGMRQRVLIAVAIASSPRILLADEPTTALDVIIQDQILSLLLELQRDSGMSMMLVSHDLGVIAEMCDRIAVMYGGQIVELGDTETLLTAPRHPYTISLLRSLPDAERRARFLPSIPGTPPRADRRRAGLPVRAPLSRSQPPSAERGRPSCSPPAAAPSSSAAGATTMQGGPTHGRSRASCRCDRNGALGEHGPPPGLEAATRAASSSPSATSDEAVAAEAGRMFDDRRA